MASSHAPGLIRSATAADRRVSHQTVSHKTASRKTASRKTGCRTGREQRAHDARIGRRPAGSRAAIRRRGALDSPARHLKSDPKVVGQYQHVVIHPSLQRDKVDHDMDWYCARLASPKRAAVPRRYDRSRVGADGGYGGDKLRQAITVHGDWTIEIIKRSDAAGGFVRLPRRWAAERTFAWLSRCRRLAKDRETSIASSTTWALIVSIRMITRRTARYCCT